MKKVLFVLATLLLCLTPALAQRGQRPQHQQRQQQQHERQPRQVFHDGGHNMDRREPAEHRDHVRNNPEYRSDHHGWFGGRHEDRGREARDRWDGRRHRFDDSYYNEHFGIGHRFYGHHCAWYGPRFYPGSRFWYGGTWFVIVDSVPDYWGDEEVYIYEDDGFYYLMNPSYPGQRFAITVVF